MKYLIIDGQFLVYKSFFSHQGLTATYKGVNMASGIPFGFLKALIDMKIKFMPNFILVTWEGHPLIKKEMWPWYKAKRKPLETDINKETELTRSLITSLKIPSLWSPGYEGEDVARFLRKRLVGKKHTGYFYTNDEDAFALIKKNFTLINNINGEYLEMDLLRLKETKDLTPKQARQIKILAGCNSDNIPGFTGIGEVTATYLIKKYGTAENVVKNINETEKKWSRFNEVIKQEAHKLGPMTLVTEIKCPEEVKVAYKRYSNDWQDTLRRLECRTLLKGAEYRVLNLIAGDQKKYFTKVTERIKL